MERKSEISLYGRTQFEYVIVCLLIFFIFAIVTTGLVWGGSVGNARINPSVSGSGFLSETISSVSGDKITYIKVAKISFGGKALLDSNNVASGSWHIKLFDVNDDSLDNAEFRAEDITALSFSTSACGKSAHLEAFGKLNNKLGWSAIIDMSEQPDSSTMRIRLYHPAYGWVYDTANQFTNSSSCEGQTFVDSGNLKITMP